MATRENGEARWYALYLRSRFEKKAHRELEREHIECFLPLIEETHVWSDRKKNVQEPLFRGYLFVRSNLSDKKSILQPDGVVRFVGIRNRPSPIPDEQINWIRIVVNHPDKVHRDQYLSVGERVRVAAGVFKGIEGIVARLKGTTRVVIALDAIAQAVSVEVVPEFLESIPDRRSAAEVQQSFRLPVRNIWKNG